MMFSLHLSSPKWLIWLELPWLKISNDQSNV
jgi:hypothetical protein